MLRETRDTDYYLRNLEKWQARSHPNLVNRKPEEIFDKDFVAQYKRLHRDIWMRICNVHGTLCTLSELETFPFEYLYAPGRMEFWRLVVENFLNSAGLTLHGLVEEGKDVHSISSFRDVIFQGLWLQPEQRDWLKETLKKRDFDKHIKSIQERVRIIRNNRVAHRLINKKSGSPREALGTVSLRELWLLFDATHSLFGALSFGSAYVTLLGDLIPGTVGGQPTRTCLDDVLDAVLRDSYFVNEPERREQWWRLERGRMKLDDLQLMNDLRKRIGLPEA
jgi:hypothetical protein